MTCTQSGKCELETSCCSEVGALQVGQLLSLASAAGGAKNEYLSVPADKSLDGVLDSTVTIAVDAAGPQPTQWQLMVDSRPLIVESSMLEAPASAREGV